MAEEGDTNGEVGQNDRREFLKTAGRFALVAPPAMTMLLSTSMSSPAIAKSACVKDDHDKKKTKKKGGGYCKPEDDDHHGGGGWDWWDIWKWLFGKR